MTPPERTGQVRDVLRGRPARPVRQELPGDRVEAALRRLPSHGWINGWFGRRDRALLVLAQAGVPYRRIAALTAGDITLTDTVATINTTIGLVTLYPDEDPVLCGPCALVRWLRALHLALTSPATRTLAGAIDRAAAVDGESPHLCCNLSNYLAHSVRIKWPGLGANDEDLAGGFDGIGGDGVEVVDGHDAGDLAH